MRKQLQLVEGNLDLSVINSLNTTGDGLLSGIQCECDETNW